jgi:hypothetical protein
LNINCAGGVAAWSSFFRMVHFSPDHEKHEKAYSYDAHYGEQAHQPNRAAEQHAYYDIHFRLLVFEQWLKCPLSA